MTEENEGGPARDKGRAMNGGGAIRRGARSRVSVVEREGSQVNVARGRQGGATPDRESRNRLPVDAGGGGAEMDCVTTPAAAVQSS
jgi:hypothetical protein